MVLFVRHSMHASHDEEYFRRKRCYGVVFDTSSSPITQTHTHTRQQVFKSFQHADLFFFSSDEFFLESDSYDICAGVI